MDKGHSPLDQFEIKKIKEIELFGLDISFTNSALFMILASVALVLFVHLASNSRKLVPSRMQMMGEGLYHFILGMVKDNIGDHGRHYFPFIFSLFMFVLFCNLFGMLPYSFTVTSHIMVTMAMASMVFIVIFTMGFAKFGFRFLSIFVPSGAPKWMLPFLISVEFLSYMARPISLSIRLAANMTAGHTMLKVIASFVVPMGLIGAAVPMLFLVLLTGFEIFVAMLQAYIFSILACVYLSDTVNLHH